MSLRNRARSLQKKTGLTYQQALARLRALGDRPATLRRKTRWPLEACDRFLVDGHAPILVEEVPPVDDAPIEAGDSGSVYERIRAVCEALVRSMPAARAVDLVDPRGDLLLRVGAAGDDGQKVELHIRRDWRESYVTAATQATLRVWFDANAKLLVFEKRRAYKAAGAIERLLGPGASPTMPPASGGGGTGGLPNELRVVEPVPEERPKPKPTPIGRRRKRER